jgi:putative tricarboxylic transport membrane protein
LTAMMLTVFYVHNVIPGPALFRDNLDFVYALYIAMLLLNIIVVVFVSLSSNLLMKIIQIPTRFLGVTILTLSFVGVYSLRNSVTDCMISAGFGMLGLVLKRQNLPIVPVILGMVLGGIMEVKLRSAMAQVKTPLDFVDRPIAAILAIAIVLLIGFHFWGIIRERRLREPESSHDHDIHGSQQS